MPPTKQPESVDRSATLSIPEQDQSKASVLNTLASHHSRRSYEYAIERFIAWYCSEPRLTFNRSVVVKYRSFLERLSLSAATINLHLSAIRRLADESAESGWLSPEHAIGIRRVKGVKRLGRKMGNWLTRNLHRGGNTKMGILSCVVQQLRRERESAQKQIQRIDEALAALGSGSSNGTSRTMSASARRRISLAQKARWAKRRTAKPKRTISAAGRKRIAAAQRARWAKV